MQWSCFFLLLNFIFISSLQFQSFARKVYNRRYVTKDGVLGESFSPSFNRGIGEPSIIYADRDIIVVNKPANLQTAPGHIHKNSLAGRIAEIFSIARTDQMVVHRLDYATSGLVVFARNEVSLKSLHRQFRSRVAVEKVYMAVVVGAMQGAGVVDLPIAKDVSRGPPYYCIDRTSITAKHAMTHWSVVDSTDSCSLVKLIPVTGRTHQLRLHMASLGHPVVGDKFYPPPSPARNLQSGSNFIGGQDESPPPMSAAPGAFGTAMDGEEGGVNAERLLLHAQELRFTHPSSGDACAYLAPCPFDLSYCLCQI